MNNAKMALLIPSRGRPDNIKRWMQAIEDTEATVDVYVGIDPDDPKYDDYWRLSLQYKNLYIDEGTERQRFGPTLNRLCSRVVNDYKYIMWAGDDHMPRSKHWDKEYIGELEKLKVGIVYGNDLVMGEAIATQLAMTSNIVEALGYAVPEGFVHLYIDNYFMELARSIGKLVYLPEVIVQHMHPCAGMAQEDQTYIEANSPENWTNDRIRLEKYMQEELESDKQKLVKLL